jgi:hypothetical protein
MISGFSHSFDVGLALDLGLVPSLIYNLIIGKNCSTQEIFSYFDYCSRLDVTNALNILKTKKILQEVDGLWEVAR